MELINKILIKNKERVLEIIKEWDNARFNHSLSVDDFKQFPAVLIYDVNEYDYSLSYSGRIYYGIIYLDDFEESLSKYVDNFIKNFNNHPSENDDDDKFIGCHVFAGGELNGIAGIIVGTEIDEYGEKWYKIEDEDSGYIERYIFDELKFPKIKFVYE